MKKNHSPNADLIEGKKNNGENRIFFRLLGKTFGLVIFVFSLISAANMNASGQRADAFNQNIDNTASVIRSQQDGKIIIGGYFLNVGGQARNRLARLNPDGSLDTTFVNSNLTLPVRSLALQPDGKIVVGTIGTSVPTQMGNQLWRFNADGTLDTAFNVNVNNGVYAIALQTDGKIIIGGFFSSVNGQARSRLARLNADGTLDTTFTQTPDSTVSVLTRQPDGKILVGGVFSNIDGSPRSRLARLNADGTLDTAFNSPAAAYLSGRGIQDIAVQADGKIVTGGYTSADGTLKTVARFNADGTPDTTFNQNVFSFAESFANVLAVAVQSDGKTLVGTFAQNPQRSLIRLNADGTTDTAFDARPLHQSVNSTSVDEIFVQADQKILVSGFFSRIGGAPRNNIARLFSNSLPIPATKFDFDGDGRADISAFRPSNGGWYIYQSASQFQSNGGLRVLPFGTGSDRLAPADYDGDYATDVAVFREGATAYFYIIQSRTNTFRAEPFGTTGDVPVPGDWDGDLKADLAVYRNGAAAGAQSYFYYRPTATAGIDFRQIAWGASGDKPVVADYDGDNKQDAAIFRPSAGAWYVFRSSDNQLQAMQFGVSTDRLVAADYDGDERADYAVFRDGVWYIQRSQLGFIGVAFGASGDTPAPADYDGDGKTDFAVIRNGTWYMNRSTLGAFGGNYSAAGDLPIPNAFIP
jgi:uncharacterized delta-60 repeat protein